MGYLLINFLKKIKFFIGLQVLSHQLCLSFLLPLSVLSATASELSTAHSISKKTLVLGKVSTNPKKHIKKLQPIVDYVARQMKDVGISQGKVIFARDNEQMITFLQQGRIDWITDTPFSATLFAEKTPAEIFLLRWKKGQPHYATFFITRKDSSINSIADLRDQKIALEDKSSTTGFMIPISLMRDHGLQLTELKSAREEVNENFTGYVLAGTELNISNLVRSGIADAGAISDSDWKELDRVPQNMKKQFRIFHKSHLVPRSLELVNSTLSIDKKRRLKEILLNIHKDPNAKKALFLYKKTTRFQDIDKEIESRIEHTRKLAETLHHELL